jgi:hypothetical protein
LLPIAACDAVDETAAAPSKAPAAAIAANPRMTFSSLFAIAARHPCGTSVAAAMEQVEKMPQA